MMTNSRRFLHQFCWTNRSKNETFRKIIKLIIHELKISNAFSMFVASLDFLGFSIIGSYLMGVQQVELKGRLLKWWPELSLEEKTKLN